MNEQKIPLGPVAPMVAVKQLGTNGGGWYGPNSAVPLENPTPFSNLLETLAIILMPGRGRVHGRAVHRPPQIHRAGVRQHAADVGGCRPALACWSEAPIRRWPAELPALMEGKEVRFGADASALWATLTTQTSQRLGQRDARFAERR